jgi:hypothetical protein
VLREWMRSVGRDGLRLILPRLVVLGLVLVGLQTTVVTDQSSLARSKIRSVSIESVMTAENATSSLLKGCSLDSMFWNQHNSGRFSLCLRVPPSVGTATYLEIRSFGTYVQVPPSLKAVMTRPAPVRVVLTPKSGPPGTEVTVHGTLLEGRRGPGSSYIDLCWNSCRSGLSYQAVPARWSSSTSFVTRLRVPSAPWIQRETHTLRIHPLTAGKYQIGVVCVGTQRGCALGRSAGSQSFRLTVPRGYRVCGGHPLCDHVTISPSSAYPGELVRVQGWAPLDEIVSHPFGFGASFSSVYHSPHAVRVLVDHIKNYDSLQLPTARLRLRPELTWGSFPQLPVLNEQFNGYSAVAVLNAQNDQYLWCGPGGVLTGRPGTSKPGVISSASVAKALLGSGYSIESSPTSSPACQAVAVNPAQPSVVDASFSVTQGPSPDAGGPPFGEIAMQTVNGGVSWSMIPAPQGTSPEDFGGFIEQGSTVEAVFASNSSSGSVQSSVPGTPDRVVVPVSISASSGTSWTSGTLSCPTTGPCLRFGPASLGNCAMNGSPQAILREGGTASAHRWDQLVWPASVNVCYPASITSVGQSSALVVAGGSSYPLRISTDGGIHWASVAVPALRGQGIGAPLLSAAAIAMTSQGLVALAPIGSSDLMTGAYLLKPQSNRWCRVAGGPLRATINTGLISHLHLFGGNLVMRVPENIVVGSATTVGLVQVPVATLRCAGQTG